MGFAVIASFVCLAFISMTTNEPIDGEMPTITIASLIFVFFLLSTVIAMVAVIAGIGGGVIFTPIMLAFTGVNSLIIRGTGIIVAMFSGPIAIGIFTKKGLTNYRLNLIMTLSQSVGALVGASFAIMLAAEAGVTGEGFLRFGLGLILFALAVFLLKGGKKIEIPEDNYKIKRYPLGVVLLFLIGIIGGFFGMGGGWAITPTLNIGMGLPLRLAAANSNVILGLGGGVSIWPYLFAGSIIPLFVLPLIAGQIVGGFIGAHLLAHIKVSVVRTVLIGIMIFTSFTLATRGLEMVGVIGAIPPIVQVVFFGVIMVGIFGVVFAKKIKSKR